jgi:RND family efflux transporter MFP subunit
MALDQTTLASLRIEREPEPAAKPRRPVWGMAAVLVLLAGAAAVWWLWDGAIEVSTVAPVVSSGAAGGGTVLNASGYVVARRQATVSAKTTGKVAEILVEEGMAVTEGQLLARLDRSSIEPVLSLAERQLTSARVRLEENNVRLAEAERALRRSEKLRAEKLVSESQLDTAQSEVAALQARLAALKSEVQVAEGTVRVRKQEIDDLLVRAPFDGVVISKDAQQGEIISPVSAGGGFTRTGIATIVDMDSREIELDVNEAFINRVKPGQKTLAVLDAYPDWSIPSHVINIVPAADRQKATVRVRVAFDELDPRILTDMGVKVSFLEESSGSGEAVARRSVKVPSSAVVTNDDTRYVWRVTNDKAERVAVRTGAERDGQIEILAGIDGSDVLIAEPSAELVEGASVKIKRE